MSKLDLEKSVSIVTTVFLSWAAYRYYRTATRTMSAGAPSEEAVYYQKKMMVCQKLARFFGEQAISAELRYREVINA